MQHRFRYVKPIGQFWKFIRFKFERDIGKSIVDPLGKMNKLVRDREVAITLTKFESGIVQKETNLTQALDEWRKVVQTYEDKKEARQNIQKEKKADQLLASIQEANMMKTLKEKQTILSESPTEEPSVDENDDANIESTIMPQSTLSGGSKHRPRKCQKMTATAATADLCQR